MEINTSILIDVDHETQIAEARRVGAAKAGASNLSENRTSDLSIVISELASNVLKHARGGSLVIRSALDKGVEVLALDKGPGITNIDRCMKDGYSTAGTSGGGLGAVTRLATEVDIFSQPGHGTAIFARIAERDSAQSREGHPVARGKQFQTGAVCVALRGESACGDAYAVLENDERCCVLIADGLGHGMLAAEAAAAAVAIFRKCWTEPVDMQIAAIHAALRPTRGGAVAVAHIDFRAGVVHYCGIGNIAGAVTAGDGLRRMVSHNGTAGLREPKISVFRYAWESSSLLVMHSDGLATRWELVPYPGLGVKHPALIAGVLFRDFARGRDDATVVAIRRTPR